MSEPVLIALITGLCAVVGQWLISRSQNEKRKVEEAIAAGDKSVATAAVSTYASKLDKAAKRGVIKSNTADRKKARTAAALAKLA